MFYFQDSPRSSSVQSIKVSKAHMPLNGWETVATRVNIYKGQLFPGFPLSYHGS